MPAQSLPQLVGNAGALGQMQHVDDLVAGREQHNFNFAVGNLPQVAASGAVSSGSSQWYSFRLMTVAPRASSPASRLAFGSPYSCNPTV